MTHPSAFIPQKLKFTSTHHLDTMFMAAVFVVAENWKQLLTSVLGEWLNCASATTDDYLAIQMKGPLMHTRTWMDLKATC